MEKIRNPFFSIIVPVYNSEKYIRKCIASVINQTFASWELILVDDGSTDSSGMICDSFNNDFRIKVLHQKNAGPMNSRINGISISTGIYMLGLDSDDYLDIDCLDKLRRAIEISGSDLIFFGYRLSGRQRISYKCSLTPGKIYSQKELMEEIIENTNHSLWNKAIKMDKVKQADYSGLNKRISINLDYAQIIPIICKINSGYVIDDVLYNYRIHGDSVSHSCSVQHIFDTDYVTEYIIHKLKTEGLMDESMYDKIYLAYFKIIQYRLLKLFYIKGISKEDCRKIHRSKVYQRSKKVETVKNLGRSMFITLKLFRYRQYWALRLIAEYYKNCL